jgi:predicted GNAT family acetyltransferase
MDIAIDDLEVINNEPARQFEIHIGHQIAFLTYTRKGDTIAYTHAEVPPSLEGHGVAARLSAHALDYARANKLDVVPLCSYVADYVRRHPAYEDLVASPSRWKPFLRA